MLFFLLYVCCVAAGDGDGEGHVGDGELFFGGVEDDVVADGHYEEGYWRAGGLIGVGNGGAGEEVRRCGPVVVEKGVFIALGFEAWEAGGEESEVGCEGEEWEGVGERRGDEDDLRWV